MTVILNKKMVMDFMVANKLTGVALCEKCGISSPTFAKIRDGRRVNLVTAACVAEKLEVNYSELIIEEEK